MNSFVGAAILYRARKFLDEDMQKIMGYGVMATPAVVVDGVVVHAGGVPTTEKIAACLTRAAATPRCCG